MLTPGEFSVSAGGAASYSIKLRVPQGVAGVVPDLTLAYNSQAPNGILGVGWSLAGLSAITRCPQNAAQDGSAWAGGISYTASDRYCLDGQRLVAGPNPATPAGPVGAYGANGTFYATETESFSRVQSFGSFATGSAPNGQATYGPSYFIVKTRSGLTMEYGNTAESKVKPLGVNVAAMWALNKVTDTKGNFMTIAYNVQNDGTGQSYPTRIEYTSNTSVSPALAPTSRVDFEYDASRPDAAPMFVGGTSVTTTVRMNKVKMTSAGTTVREYRITYDTAAPAPQRSLIASIQECAPNNECLPATSFVWSSPASGWQPTASWTSGPDVRVPIDEQCITADLNGDGKVDLACYTGNNSGIWHVMLSSGTGWTGSTWSGGADPGFPVGAQCVSGDFNGDGKADFACYSYNNGNPGWHMTFSTGAGWTSATWTGPQPGVPVGGQCLTGDYNADGKTDLTCYTGNSQVWHMALSTGTSFSAPFWGSGADPAVPIQQQCFSGDFDGDGRTDLACYTGGGGVWHVTRSTGTSWGSAGSTYWSGGPHANFAGDRCVAGDFNGDGKTDLACYTGDGLGTWHVGLSKGASAWQSTFWSSGPDVRFPLSDQCRTGDFNGDGKTDLACLSSYAGTWFMAFSTGTQWSITSWPNGVAPGEKVGNQCITGDITGDGKTDLVCYPGSGTTWLISAPQPQFNGLVTSVNRPFGNVATVTYKNATQTVGDRYTMAATVSPPQQIIVPGAALVTDVDVPNGIGGTRRTSYWYDSAIAEPSTGRGYLGFRSQKRTDIATGVSTTTVYRQDPPYQGQAETASTATAAGALLTQTTTTFDCRDPAASLASTCVVAPGRRYFVYPQVALAKAWDLNGAAMPWTRTTNQGLDAWGNFQSVGTETLNAGGIASDHSKWVTSVYFNDVNNWLLGRLLKSTVVASGPTVPASVVPGSGGFPPPPPPQLPSAVLNSVLPAILQLLLDD